MDLVKLKLLSPAPKRLVTCDTKHLLRAKLANAGVVDQPRRLDLHMLNEKGSALRLVKLHVMVDLINVSEAEEFIVAAMEAAYSSESSCAAQG